MTQPFVLARSAAAAAQHDDLADNRQGYLLWRAGAQIQPSRGMDACKLAVAKSLLA